MQHERGHNALPGDTGGCQGLLVSSAHAHAEESIWGFPTDLPRVVTNAAGSGAGRDGLTPPEPGAVCRHPADQEIRGWRAEPRRLFGHRRAPLLLLVVVLLLSTLLRVDRLDQPAGGGKPGPGVTAATGHDLIFDEKYYVDAARVIAGLHDSFENPYFDSPQGLDPNREHPPLGKLFMVAGIKIFGDGPIGWRLPSVLFGTLELLLLYWLIRRLRGSSWLALAATSLMAADNLSMVHGRIATLDVFVATFMIAGAGLYLSRWRLRLGPLLGGVVLGLGCCVKQYGVYAWLALALYEVLQLLWPRRAAAGEVNETAGLAGPPVTAPRGPGLGRQALSRLASLALCGAMLTVTYFVVLTILDHAVTTYTGPLAAWHHTQYMIEYGKNLRSVGGPQGIASYPWLWWFDVIDANYYMLAVNGSPVIAFQGLISPAILTLALPALGVALVRGLRGDRAAALAFVWVLASWAPFALLSALDQRTTYLYYMVVIMPGVYLAVAQLLSKSVLPWRPFRIALTALFVAAVLVCLVLFYPFRTLAL